MNLSSGMRELIHTDVSHADLEKEQLSPMLDICLEEKGLEETLALIDELHLRAFCALDLV